MMGVRYNAGMKSRGIGYLVAVGCLLVVGLQSASGAHKVLQELVGTWDYISMTSLKNGKPFGTVHFNPGQWTVTFNSDGTWAMKTPSNLNGQGLSGSYDVRGRDLDMKRANGKPYDDYRFSIEQDGKALVLTTKEVTITANRE
jgi:hypothetical protein